MYGQRSHLVTAEYWRWWVVHLWVEGFFEVFATVVIAFLFTRLSCWRRDGHARACFSRRSSSFRAASSGRSIICTSPGRRTVVLALGATFSALEVVPLVLIGFEAWENIRLSRHGRNPWISAYKWPIYFFVAVAFWNFVGAGLFGFLINPPIALYYMQGLNTDARAWTHGAVRRLRHARPRADAVLPARAATRAAWKDRPLSIRVLVDQHRAGARWCC